MQLNIVGFANSICCSQNLQHRMHYGCKHLQYRGNLILKLSYFLYDSVGHLVLHKNALKED